MSVMSLTIVTANRPRHMARALISYANSAAKQERVLTFRVIDNSTEPTACRQNMEEVSRIQQALGFSAVYIGQEQTQGFADRLLCAGIDREVIDFALFNPLRAVFSAGAARNICLLATVGEMALIADDDTICSFIPMANTFPDLSVTSQEVPTSSRFYQSRQELIASSVFHQCDFVQMHELALGRQVSDLIRSFTSLHEIKGGLGPTFRQDLDLGRGQVLLTQCGVVGDSGINSPSTYFASQGTTRINLLRSANAYHSATSSRQVRSVVDAYTLTDSPFFMAYAAGIDNRSGLVPFFPIQRNEDGIFGMAIRRCFKQSYTCHLPYAIYHYPLEERYYRKDWIQQDSANIRLCDIVLACMECCVFDTMECDASCRLHKLGDYLIEIGSLPNREFWETVCGLIRLRVLAQMKKMDVLFKAQESSPDYWTKDIKEFAIGRQRILHGNRIPIPEDISVSHDDPIAFIKLLILKYGKLLKAWPDLVEVATYIRRTQELGVSLSE